MKRLKRPSMAVLLALPLFLNGCMVNQAKDVETYRQVLDAGAPKPAGQFHSEDPLTLRRALRLANARNEQLAISGEDYLQALINEDRAFSAFLPTISFAPAFMRQEKTALAADNPLIASFVPDKTTDVPVQGGLNLHPLRDLPAFRSAGFSARMQKALLLDARSVILLDVAKTYFHVMSSEKRIQALTYSVKVQRRRLNDARVKYSAGAVRHLDVSLAEDGLAKVNEALIQAKNDERNGRAMLALLIGAPSVDGPLTGGMEVRPGVWRVRDLLALAEDRRQDLAAARAQVRAASAALESAWGEYFPSVSLNLTRYLSRQSFPSDVDWTSLIQVNVPVFSAGLIHADVRAAYSRLRQARLAELSLRRQVLKDLRVAVEDLSDDGRQAKELEVQVETARERVRQARAGVDAGAGTDLGLMSAQDRLSSSSLALAVKRFDMDVDYLRLLRMAGVLDPGLSVRLGQAKSPLPDGRVAKTGY